MSDHSRSDTRLVSGLVSRSDETRAWEITVNGQPLAKLIGEPVRTMQIDCVRNTDDPEGTRLGRLEYGAQPDQDGRATKFDTWLWREAGGAVTLPYAVIDGLVWVGVVEERRFAERHPVHNPEGTVLNAPRGFHDPDAGSTDVTARAELREEVGLFTDGIVRLPGDNINCNNAWIGYEDERRDDEPIAQGGVTLYAVKVNAGHLKWDAANARYLLPSEITANRPKGSAYEKIGRCVFVSWDVAVQLRDGFTAIAVARLMLHLSIKREAGHNG